MTAPLYFVEHGPSSGVPLVLIHPLGADRHFWDETVKHFGQGVHAIQLDLRGSGQSPDLERPLTLEQTVEDIEAIRRHLGLARIVVVGCAIGGMAAALYAARHVDHAAGLIVSNPAIRITPEAGESLAQRAELVRAKGMVALLPGAIENAFVGYADTEARRTYEAAFLAQSASNYAFAASGAIGADISEDLTRVTCPTLLVVGANDRLMSPANAPQIACLVTQAQTVEFEDGAHFIPYQQPVRFGTLVADYLDRHGLRPE